MILIIDDDSAVRSSLSFMLKRAGYEVKTAFLSNPKEENRLRDSRHQARLANAIFTGIRTAVRKDPSILKQT